MLDALLCRYLASALVTPLVVPLVLILIPWWRYPFRTMCGLAASLEFAILSISFLIFSLFGTSDTGIWLVGTLPPLICVAAFAYCCELRDGRFLFLIVTLGVAVSMCDSLATIVAPRDEPLWLVCKVLVTFIQAVLLLCVFRKPLLDMLETNAVNWGQFSAVPFALWAVQFANYMPAVYAHTTVPVPQTLLLSGTSLLIYVVLYRFQRAVHEYTEAEQYNAMLQSEVGFLQRQTQHDTAMADNMRIFRHDMRHYTNMLRGCIKTGNQQAAEEILSLMEKNAQSFRINQLCSYTGSPLLDTVLAQTAEQAKMCGVGFEVQLVLPEVLRVNAAELAVVISNALENAVKAAAKEPAGQTRTVRIASPAAGEQFLVVITNPFSGTLRRDQDRPASCRTGRARLRDAVHRKLCPQVRLHA